MMSNLKSIQMILFAVGALFLSACGKDWKAEVDRAVEAYEAGRYDEAVPVFVEAANHGHDGGQYMLCLCYDGTLNFVDGDDIDRFVETDMEEAVKWYRKAGKQGHGLAESMANALEVVLKGKKNGK